MDRKAQTAVEYILLVGAVIFLVILVFLIVRQRIFGPSGNVIDTTSRNITNLTRSVTQ